jgi:hypothetical protein
MFYHTETRPIYTGTTTTTTDKNIIRAAQALVPDGVLVRAGADIDTIADSGRYDHVHFNATGAVAQSALKVPLFENFLSNG